ncbi:putative ammonium transporter 3-like protein [Leptotrombidium deliense]|uniref:Putative ammonium transporter 3-like protein n=1 Tax=Leptotrombidium deliense TaxID=299467 RepID=A0A443SNK9_9ACAR|nr:putative ammonium transporter 3-like protein [Leptotrombidium deliense]
MATSVNSTTTDFIHFDDATWILTSSFIIFTMQTGFSLLESGCVRKKSEVSVMMKNCIDPLFNGMAYWIVGYGLSVSRAQSNGNSFFAFGQFFVDSTSPEMGELFANYVFRLSLSATTTTIAAGAMSERVSFEGYCLFSFMNTILFSIPSHWIWSAKGFLRALKVVDIAGCLTVYFIGALSALISTIYLKPRDGRFALSTTVLANSSFKRDQRRDRFAMSSPTGILVGTYMLWWGGLGLNMGSTFGVSAHKWKYASRASIATMISTVAGGTNALFISFITKNGKFDIILFTTGLLSSMVAISGGCTLFKPWESFVIGTIASSFGISCIYMLQKLQIDDPSNIIAIHLPASIFGVLAVGLLVEKDTLSEMTFKQSGLLRSHDFYFIGVQCFALIATAIWTTFSTYFMLFTVNTIFPLRISIESEYKGCDFVDHNIDYRSNDDNILPQSTMFSRAMNTSPHTSSKERLAARRSFRKVMNALKFTRNLKGVVDQNIIRRLKQRQTKNMSLSWLSLN